MTTYTAADTAAWSQDDWDRLAGKTLGLAVPGGVYEAKRTAEHASISESGRTVTVDWAGAGSVSFSREFGAEITIHD